MSNRTVHYSQVLDPVVCNSDARAFECRAIASDTGDIGTPTHFVDIVLNIGVLVGPFLHNPLGFT